MTRSQLARTVADGKLISFTLLDGEPPVIGYLAGMDDFHWFVLTPEVEQVFVHKGSASRFSVASESTYDAEPRRDELEKIIASFRSSLAREGLVPPHTVRQQSQGATT